ncbi:MAG: CCA tRNA nucleotidyltransferase [Micrococcales bacterium]|nr:CCA tRNA nucleotidyltransferase [Micrococcales bacterium]
MRTVAEALANLQRTSESPLLVKLGNLFGAAGFEIALVGGPVRDAFLARPTNDLDFTTSAKPDEIVSVLTGSVDAIWDVGRDFGTIGARIGDTHVEITTYRADKYDADSRKPIVAFGTDLNDDLFRRDFTINAMALRLPEGVFVDPFNGLQDLLEGTIRTPGKPEDSFNDDPLRIMRAARFASQLGFLIQEETFSAMKAMAERIAIVSAERIQVELTKLLLGAQPREGIEALVDCGIAEIVFPEIPALKLEVDEHHHHKDVYEHTLTVLEQAIDYEKKYSLEQDIVLRLAALMHDIGKPQTRKLESGGGVTFYHHDVVGAKLATKRLRELRFDNDTIKSVARLIELHLRFFGYSDQAWSDSAIRRYVRDADELLTRLHALTRSDVTTRNQRKAERLAHAYDDLENRIEQLAKQEELAAIRPDLSGEEIMEVLDIKPGPEVGLAYRFLMELRLDEGPLGYEEAKKRLLSWWASR